MAYWHKKKQTNKNVYFPNYGTFSGAKTFNEQNRKKQIYFLTGISAYLCAKCKVLFDTITVYDEHLENCKNSPENYNFDEVLEKLGFVIKFLFHQFSYHSMAFELFFFFCIFL